MPECMQYMHILCAYTDCVRTQSVRVVESRSESQTGASALAVRIVECLDFSFVGIAFGYSHADCCCRHIRFFDWMARCCDQATRHSRDSSTGLKLVTFLPV